MRRLPLKDIQMSLQFSADTTSENIVALGQAAELKLSFLTPSELKVLVLITLGGKSSKEATGSLYIAKHTVEAHRANLMETLGAHSLSDLFEIVTPYRNWQLLKLLQQEAKDKASAPSQLALSLPKDSSANGSGPL